MVGCSERSAWQDSFFWYKSVGSRAREMVLHKEIESGIVVSNEEGLDDVVRGPALCSP